jgi:hypothetical protein
MLWYRAASATCMHELNSRACARAKVPAGSPTHFVHEHAAYASIPLHMLMYATHCRACSTRCAKPQPHIARAASTARGTVGSKTTPCRSSAVYFSPRVSRAVGIGACGCRAGPARSAPRCRPPRRACAVVSAGLLPARTPRGAEYTARTLRGEQASASSPCRFGVGCGSYD